MAVPIIQFGSVAYVATLDVGMGYLSTPQVRFVGGSGSGASGFATVDTNHEWVVNITVVHPGSGYNTTPPTIQVDPPPVTNASLPGQTNSTLVLSPAMISNSTNYFVVITNNYGSVTSATVYLKVFLPPQNFAVENLGTNLQLQLAGSPYYPYILQTATNLTLPINWQPVFTNYADSNGLWQFTETDFNESQKFYRAVGQ